MKENGISSMLVPRAFGGPGATHAEACAVLAEIGKADAAAAVTLSMHFHLVATQVWWYDPQLVTGLLIGWVPIEEYLFFILQPLLTGLWLAF